MKVHELATTKQKSAKRVGRGISAGGGKTAGRGTKGQNSRTGNKFKPGFEGGQTKLAMRLPKARGFTPLARVSYQVVNLDDIEALGKKIVTPEILKEVGLIRRAKQPVKLLGSGTIKLAVNIKVDKASAAAIKAVEKAGGKVEVTPPKPKPTKKIYDPNKAK